MLKTYYMLTKPGIIAGNIVTTAGGFALGSKGEFDVPRFIATLAGLALVVASAGVYNNYIDRAADAKMSRTKDRPLAKGSISPALAIVFGLLLGMAGTFILAAGTNLLTVFVAIAGFFVYLVPYAIMKYRSFYGTLVGSLAGAVPPLAGYAAASGRLDMAAWLLFAIVVLWQMPHFFAIAIYRIEDYSAAAIPVLPLEKGMDATKLQMLLYIAAFIATALLLTFEGYAGSLFGWIVALLGFSWMGLCLWGFAGKSTSDSAWAYRMFVCSLVVIMGLFVVLPFDVNRH